LADSLNGSSSDNSQLIRFNFIEIFAGLLILAALLSRSSLDPTPFNLLWPYSGIKNVLSLPGALTAGLLFDLFGWSSLFIPLFLLFLKTKVPGKKRSLVLLNPVYFLLLVSLIALCFPASNHLLGVSTGFWGITAHSTLISFPGRPISLLLIALYLIRQTIDYRVNLQIFEILKLVLGILLWYIRRFLGATASGLNQLNRSCTDFWSSSLKPRLLQRNRKAIQAMTRLKQRIGQQLSRTWFVDKTKSVFIDSTKIIKARIDAVVPSGDKYGVDQTKVAADEYEILQNALKEFEREYYPNFMAKPR